MTDLNVKTSDGLKLSDKLKTIKRWFNGAKHFFMVKLLPPRR